MYPCQETGRNTSFDGVSILYCQVKSGLLTPVMASRIRPLIFQNKRRSVAGSMNTGGPFAYSAVSWSMPYLDIASCFSGFMAVSLCSETIDLFWVSISPMVVASDA